MRNKKLIFVLSIFASFVLLSFAAKSQGWKSCCASGCDYTNCEELKELPGYYCTYDGYTWDWRTSFPKESSDVTCSDRVDNDCDTTTDCKDESCIGRIGPNGRICCFTASDCDDGDPTTMEECKNNECYYKKDEKAPTTRAVCNDNVCSGWYKTDVNVKLLCSDDYSGCKVTYYCVDTANACRPTSVYYYTFTVNNDAINYIRYYSIDVAENKESIKSTKVKIDRVSPSTTLECNDASCSSDWYTSDVSIKLSCSDATSGCDKTYYCIDTTNTCTPTTKYIKEFSLPEGVNYIRYYSIDVAGNSELIQSQKVKLDKTSPSISIIKPEDLVANPYELEFTISDAISHINKNKLYCQLDTITGEWTSISSSTCTGKCDTTAAECTCTIRNIDCNSGDPGNHTIYIKASDRAANEKISSKTFTIAARPYDPGIKIKDISERKGLRKLGSNSVLMTTLQSISITLEVINYGELEDDIELSTNIPAGWESTLSKTKIKNMGSMSKQEIMWTVTPHTENGEFTATATASSASSPTQSASTDLIIQIDIGAPIIEVLDYSATQNSFTIDWNATYDYYNERDVAIECVLNCDLQTEDCTDAEKCEPYPTVQPTGIGGCIVNNPTYYPRKLYGTSEFFSCKVYDPEEPELQSFKKVSYDSLDFSISVSSVSATVGQSFILPVKVKNLGLLSDNYHIIVKPLQASESFVAVENGEAYTDVATTNETVLIQPRVTVFVKKPIHLNITVTSITGSDLGFDLTESKEIEITVSEASMPEFGLFGFLQIILIAAIIIRRRH